jgi:hypothetical protein
VSQTGAEITLANSGGPMATDIPSAKPRIVCAGGEYRFQNKKSGENP